MVFFRRKKIEYTIEESNSKLKELTMQTNVLLYMVDNDEPKKQLERLNRILRYMAPSNHATAYKIENEISKLLFEIKRLATLNRLDERINQYLEQIEVLIIERKHYK